MTPMPRTKLASFPSLRLLAPSARPSSAKTKLGDAIAEIGQRQLAIAPRRPRAGEDLAGIQGDDDLVEAQHFVLVGIGERRGVAGAVLQHHLNRLRRAIHDHAAGAGQVDDGLRRVLGVGRQHVLPAAGQRDLPDVEDHVREVFEEDPGAYLALGPVCHDLQRQLAKGLVGVGHRPEHDP
jgi:hypothetical protein